LELPLLLQKVKKIKGKRSRRSIIECVMQMTFATMTNAPLDRRKFSQRINLNKFFFSFKYFRFAFSKQYNENIKNHNDVPENSEPEKKRKPKFYNNLRLDQCEKDPKTNSKLTRFF
jgi:hypothetical protein